MKSVEKAGLLKMDFLGLRTLTILEDACDLIAERTGSRPSLAGIPIDDEITFDLLRTAKTVAIFQLESSGMRDLLRRLAPETFDDIVAVNALFRPGPMGSGMVSDFIDCKHGKKSIRYEHESSRADPARHLRDDGVPGAGDADRQLHGRIHPRGSRHPPPGHGQEEKAGDGRPGTEVRDRSGRARDR